MNKGILKLALSGNVPLQFEYRDPSGGSTAERSDSAVNERLDNAAKAQIADAFAWLLHVI
ncbi:MAG TPA: hypothetical protein VGV15_09325 [Terriglobales bacterium]|nr:hypothetical protein [Terriglobales bacterium]